MPKDISTLIDLGRKYVEQLPELAVPQRRTSLASYLDNALHDPAATPYQVNAFCDQAAQDQIATVFINPVFVSTAKSRLEKSKVHVGTVAGFPLGAFPTETKLHEARTALDSGADEIDMVIQVGLLKAGEFSFIFEEIQKMSDLVHSYQGLIKVILEVCLLDKYEIIMGSLISKSAGADFVKTSTGFSAGGATIEDIDLMRRVVGTDMGVKAAGGIHTLEEALSMIGAGADRIGTRLAHDILAEDR